MKAWSEYFGQYGFLSGTGGHKNNVPGVINYRQGQRDAHRRRFRGIKNSGHPVLSFIQKGMIGEKRGDMPVFADPQQYQVESRKSAVPGLKYLVQSGLVSFGRFRGPERTVQGMDLIERNIDMSE